MEGEGERKRKAGPLEIDWNVLLPTDDEEPPSELVIKDAEEDGRDEDSEKVQYYMKLSLSELISKIALEKRMLTTVSLKLPDGGDKLRTNLKIMEAELERRKLLEDVEKGKKSRPLADGSLCAGANGLSNRAPISSLDSQSSFAVYFSNNLDERANGKTKAFREELSTLNRCDQKSMRLNRKFLSEQTHKIGLSSRQAPFKSPSHLSVNIDDPLHSNDEQLESQSYTTPCHSDKDAPSCLTKKAPHLQHSRASRHKNQKTVVLVDEEELDNDVPDLGVKVIQRTKDAQIYYPLRDDPRAVEISYSDLECLDPEKFLSSPIMNFYIRYLQKRTSSTATKRCEYHFFDTYVYKKLKQHVLTKIDKETSFVKFRRWWKGVNIFEKAYIFLPIHENHHWSLVIICMPDKQDEFGPLMLHLDSLGMHASKSIFDDVKSFLTEEWRFLRQEVLPELPIAEKIWANLSRRIEEKVIEVPRQKNDYDCGVFVLFFMERFIDEFPDRMKKTDLGMFGRQWFKPEQASNLRHKIRDLLREEFNNANIGT